MTILETENLILRDLLPSDIAKREYWETVDTEWQLWDAPWEYEGLTEQEQQAERQAYLAGLSHSAALLAHKPAADIRRSFQLVEKSSGEYIGWVNAYNIDADYNYTTENGLLTLGLDLPAQSSRSKGYGTEALRAVLQYYAARGYNTLYTQTWSGNSRMVHLAAKLGFRLVFRKEGNRTVRGEKYDGLTFAVEL